MKEKENMNTTEARLDWTKIAETTVRPRDAVTQPYRIVLRVHEINTLKGRQFEYSHHLKLEEDGSLHDGVYDTHIVSAVRTFKLRAKQHNVKIMA